MTSLQVQNYKLVRKDMGAKIADRMSSRRIMSGLRVVARAAANGGVNKTKIQKQLGVQAHTLDGWISRLRENGLNIPVVKKTSVDYEAVAAELGKEFTTLRKK